MAISHLFGYELDSEGYFKEIRKMGLPSGGPALRMFAFINHSKRLLTVRGLICLRIKN
jgi:hypothetical protein